MSTALLLSPAIRDIRWHTNSVPVGTNMGTTPSGPA